MRFPTSGLLWALAVSKTPGHLLQLTLLVPACNPWAFNIPVQANQMAFNWSHLKLCLWAREPEPPWFTCQSGWQCQEVNNGNWLILQLIPSLGRIFLRCDPWFPTKMTPTFYTEMDFNPPEILTRILYYQTTQVNNTQLTRNGLDKGKDESTVSHLFLTRRERRVPVHIEVSQLSQQLRSQGRWHFLCIKTAWDAFQLQRWDLNKRAILCLYFTV